MSEDTKYFEYTEPFKFTTLFDIAEGETSHNEYVDVELNIVSLKVNINKNQYTIEDLEQNRDRLNAEGGLIIAMGPHPKQMDISQIDPMRNVGIGLTRIEDGILKAKARVWNTALVPDMVFRVRNKLVRGISIEGVVKAIQRHCDKTQCWNIGIGLHIIRAAFVSNPSDPEAQLTKIIESVVNTVENMNKKKETEIPEIDNIAVVESTTGTETVEGKKEVSQDGGGIAVEQNGRRITEQTSGENGKGIGESVDTPPPTIAVMSSQDVKQVISEMVSKTLESLNRLNKVFESVNPTNLTPDEIVSVLNYLEGNSGIVSGTMADLMWKTLVKIDQVAYIKMMLDGITPEMVNADLLKAMKNLVNMKESEGAEGEAVGEEVQEQIEDGKKPVGEEVTGAIPADVPAGTEQFVSEAPRGVPKGMVLESMGAPGGAQSAFTQRVLKKLSK